MIYLLAVLIPGLAIMLCGRTWVGILCLALQFTILGWLPATLWALAIAMEAGIAKRVRA